MNNWRVEPFETILFYARLDAMPFNELCAAVLARAQADQLPRYMALLARRILAEGGVEKIKDMPQPTDFADDWRRLLQGENDLHALNLYAWLFEGAPFRWVKLPGARQFHEPERLLFHFRDSEALDLLRQRVHARLDGVLEPDLPKFPWEIKPQNGGAHED